MEEMLHEDSIMLAFNTPVKMRVFSWKGDRDTIMTPLDSIRYYKYFIRSSFMVEDPHNGYVKAYVGGPDFRYFKYDAVTQQRKQVGSTIKPFLYTVAMQNGYSPCYEVENIPDHLMSVIRYHILQEAQGQRIIMVKWSRWAGDLHILKTIYLPG